MSNFNRKLNDGKEQIQSHATSNVQLENEPARTSGNTNRKRKTAAEKLKDSLSVNEVVMEDCKRGRCNEETLSNQIWYSSYYVDIVMPCRQLAKNVDKIYIRYMDKI